MLRPQTVRLFLGPNGHLCSNYAASPPRTFCNFNYDHFRKLIRCLFIDGKTFWCRAETNNQSDEQKSLVTELIINCGRCAFGRDWCFCEEELREKTTGKTNVAADGQSEAEMMMLKKEKERDRKGKIEWRDDRVLGCIEELFIYPWTVSQYGQLVPEACWKCVNTAIQQTKHYSSPHGEAPEE